MQAFGAHSVFLAGRGSESDFPADEAASENSVKEGGQMTLMRLGFALVAIVMLLAGPAARNGRAMECLVIDSLQLDADVLLDHMDMRAVEIKYGNRSLLGKFFAVGFYDLLKTSIDALPADELYGVSLICRSSDGRSVSLSMAEIHPAMCQSPARILIGPAEETQRGEIVIDAGDTPDIDDGSLDLSGLKPFANTQVRERLILPHLSIDGKQKEGIAAAAMSVMTTNDVQPLRWLANIATIYLVRAH